MAQFQIDDTNGNSVIEKLAFNLNPFGSNTWNTVSGDPGVVGADSGRWDSNGIENQLVMRDDTGREVASFNINVATSLTDPFEYLRINDTGDGSLFGGGEITWTLVSR